MNRKNMMQLKKLYTTRKSTLLQVKKIAQIQISFDQLEVIR